jgi:hypothetical protein
MVGKIFFPVPPCEQLLCHCWHGRFLVKICQLMAKKMSVMVSLTDISFNILSNKLLRSLLATLLATTCLVATLVTGGLLCLSTFVYHLGSACAEKTSREKA